MWSSDACNDYSLQIATAPDPCIAAIDDGFEDNDSCVAAVALGTGMNAGLFVSDTDADYYLITVPANDTLTVDVAYATANADVDLRLYDDLACSNQVDTIFPGGGTGQVTDTNTSGAVATYVLKAEVAVGQGCNNYSLNVATVPDPCLTGVDDGFEDNDSCGSAVALPAGVTAGLFATEVDSDYYLISVAANDILTVDVSYSTANGEVDLFLYDAPGCANQVDADFTFGGTGQVAHTNSSGAAATYVLAARLAIGEVCNSYDLNIVSAPDPCLTLGDDIFEDNDTCATAAVLPGGLTGGLRMFGAAIAVDEDYWVVQNVPTGMILTVDALFIDADGDIDMQLFSDPACTSQIDGSGSVSDNESVSVNNSTGVLQDYYVRLYPVGSTFDCSDYSLQVTGTPDPCVAATDDGFEPNQSCGAAMALPMGATAGLFVSDTNQDYFSVIVPAGQILTVDLSYISGTSADMDLVLYDDAICANVVDTGFGGGGTSQVTWANATGAAATATLEVKVPSGEGCNNYDLNFSSAVDPCLDPLAEDGNAPNQDCGTTFPLIDGSYPGLFVSKAAPDYFSLSLADTDTLVVDIVALNTAADADLYLWDDAGINCGDLNTYLAQGFAGGNTDDLSYTNLSGSTMSLTLAVIHWAGDDQDCTDYDLDISGSGGVFATPFCFGDGLGVACPCANESAVGAGEGCQWSGGIGAILTAGGSNVVANDDLVLTVTQARPSQPSMLVQGSTIIGVPFKDGVLCMGNPTERVEVVFLDAAGAGSSVSSIVTEGNVSPGDTRYYQQWFRDPGGISPCGTGSNFTQGLTINWI